MQAAILNLKIRLHSKNQNMSKMLGINIMVTIGCNILDILSHTQFLVGE